MGWASSWIPQAAHHRWRASTTNLLSALRPLESEVRRPARARIPRTRCHLRGDLRRAEKRRLSRAVTTTLSSTPLVDAPMRLTMGPSSSQWETYPTRNRAGMHSGTPCAKQRPRNGLSPRRAKSWSVFARRSIIAKLRRSCGVDSAWRSAGPALHPSSILCRHRLRCEIIAQQIWGVAGFTGVSTAGRSHTRLSPGGRFCSCYDSRLAQLPPKPDSCRPRAACRRHKVTVSKRIESVASPRQVRMQGTASTQWHALVHSRSRQRQVTAEALLQQPLGVVDQVGDRGLFEAAPSLGLACGFIQRRASRISGQPQHALLGIRQTKTSSGG